MTNVIKAKVLYKGKEYEFTQKSIDYYNSLYEFMLNQLNIDEDNQMIFIQERTNKIILNDNDIKSASTELCNKTYNINLIFEDVDMKIYELEKILENEIEEEKKETKEYEEKIKNINNFYKKELLTLDNELKSKDDDVGYEEIKNKLINELEKYDKKIIEKISETKNQIKPKIQNLLEKKIEKNIKEKEEPKINIKNPNINKFINIGKDPKIKPNSGEIKIQPQKIIEKEQEKKPNDSIKNNTRTRHEIYTRPKNQNINYIKINNKDNENIEFNEADEVNDINEKVNIYEKNNFLRGNKNYKTMNINNQQEQKKTGYFYFNYGNNNNEIKINSNNPKLQNSKTEIVKKKNNSVIVLLNEMFFSDKNYQKRIKEEIISNAHKDKLADMIFKAKKKGENLSFYCKEFIEVNLLPFFKKNVLTKNQSDALKTNIGIVMGCCELNPDYYSSYYYSRDYKLNNNKAKLNRRQSMDYVRKFRQKFQISEKDFADEGIINKLEENNYDIDKAFSKMFS